MRSFSCLLSFSSPLALASSTSKTFLSVSPCIIRLCSFSLTSYSCTILFFNSSVKFVSCPHSLWAFFADLRSSLSDLFSFSSMRHFS